MATPPDGERASGSRRRAPSGGRRGSRRSATGVTTAGPPPEETDTDGNHPFYGFACENPGDGADPWPEEQLAATEKAASALRRHHGRTVTSVVGEPQWTSRKSGRKGFTVGSLRERTAARPV